MADVEFPEALVVHPGDTLVVRVAGVVTPAEFAKFADQVREKLPDKVEVLFVNAEQLGVIRGDHG